MALAAAWLPLVLAAQFFPVPAAAAEQQSIDLDDLVAPGFTTFSIRDGLPASIMADVQVDAEGYVWAASADRLARYDGNRWETEGEFAAEGTVGSLLRAHDGVLWVGFNNRGIGRLESGRWFFPRDLPTRNTFRLAETLDSSGARTLWALTIDAGLLRHAGQDRWDKVIGNEQLPRAVTDVAVTQTMGGGERLWVASASEGLWFRENDGPWQQYAGGFGDVQVNDLLVTRRDGREQLWLATYGEGLWRIDAEGQRGWRAATGELPSDMLYVLAESRDASGGSVVWAGTRAGLVRIHDDLQQVFDQRHGLPSSAVRGMNLWTSRNDTQVLWLATENGIARAVVGGTPWGTASLLGAQGSGVFAVRVEPDDRGGERLWVGGSGDGLALYQDRRWHRYTRADGLPTDWVRMIQRAPDLAGEDTLWLGFSRGELARVRPGPRFEAVATPWAKTESQAVLDVLGRRHEGARELWFATRTAGIHRWRDGVWSAQSPAEAPDRSGISSLVEQVDGEGRSWLWASGTQGLLRHDGEGFRLVGPELGLTGYLLSEATLMHEDAGEVLWIGSDHGLVWVDVSDPARPRRLERDLPAPPDPYVYGARRDSTGRIYVCTNNGIQRLVQREGVWISHVSRRRDGMPHDECNGNAQFIDARDRYWVGTLGGLGVYDPSQARLDLEPKPLRLTHVRIDGVPQPLDQAVRLPSRSELIVEFALLSWQNEDQSQFRTWLEGFESEPRGWNTRRARGIERLPPGDFILHIEARDFMGTASEPLTVPIRVIPGWWQSATAKLIFALCVVLLVSGIIEWRTRALRARQRLLADQVASRTAELAAANARLKALSYLDPMTSIGNGRRFNEALAALTQRPPSCSSLIFLDVDHFKTYNDRFGHLAGDAALRVVAKAMASCAPPEATVARYGGEEFVCLLPGQGLTQARALAQRMCDAVAASDVRTPEAPEASRVTVSAGVAEVIIATAEDVRVLVRAADDALYRAKAAGRNCVSD